MNKRLQQILDLEDLTPAKLAERIGVQPSGISHILSGRNKPSYDFINKLLHHFPNINAEWLITGKGKPYKSQSVNAEPKEDRNIFGLNDDLNNQRNSQNEDQFYDFNRENETNSLNIFNSPESQTNKNDQQSADKQGINKEIGTIQLDKNELNDKSCTTPNQFLNKNENKKALPSKKVRRITLFYSDGSFEEFYPNR